MSFAQLESPKDFFGSLLYEVVGLSTIGSRIHCHKRMAVFNESKINMPKKEMSIVGRAEGVFRNPTKFFNTIKTEKGLKAPFMYLVVVSPISSVLNYFFNPAMRSLNGLSGPGTGFVAIIMFWIMGLIFSFIIYGFFHLFVLLFGGKGGYENTYKTFVYASTPSSLLGWIPWIFFAFGLGGMVIGGLLLLGITVWVLYLIVKGLSILHKLSTGRAIGVIIVPVLIILLIAAFMAAWLAIAYVSAVAIPTV